MDDAKKHDSGKPRFDLVPHGSLLAIAKVMTYGAEKYGERNWEKGLPMGRLYAAAQRHLIAWWSGEDTDSETDESHLAHACSCLMMILQYVEDGGHELDDRVLK